jgi:hypothetical protein
MRDGRSILAKRPGRSNYFYASFAHFLVLRPPPGPIVEPNDRIAVNIAMQVAAPAIASK